MKEVNFQLGSDPELFLRDKQTGKLRSAIQIIPEGKGAGRPVDKGGQNRVLHDNVLIEFNTEPAKNGEQFVQTIGSVLKNIQTIVAEKGLDIHLQASADFPEEELRDEEARIFGCDPDFGSYPPKMNTIPADAAESPFRSAGGHLHIGKDESNPKLCALLDDPYGKISVVKALDVFVGVTSIFLDKDKTAKKRRSLYGKAGAHRPKEYGVEYRACSPWWLSSPKHTNLVYKLVQAALTVCLDDSLESVIKDVGGEEELQSIINDSKKIKARFAFKRVLAKFLDEETLDMVKELDRFKPTDIVSAWGI